MPSRQKLKVLRPESDREFQRLTREREQVERRLEEAQINLRKSRHVIDEIQGQASLGATVDHKQRRHQVERAEKAEAEIAEFKPRLRDLDDQIRKARIVASRRATEEVAPAFKGAVRTFLLARVHRHADEIAAATVVRDLANQMEARRTGFRGLQVPSQMGAAEREFARLREDVETALAAGAITRADIPKAVAEAWDL